MIIHVELDQRSEKQLQAIVSDWRWKDGNAPTVQSCLTIEVEGILRRAIEEKHERMMKRKAEKGGQPLTPNASL